MNNINKYKQLIIPDMIDADGKMLIENSNTIYYAYKALNEIHKIRVDVYKNVPIWNLALKISWWYKKYDSAKKLNEQCVTYEWSRRIIEAYCKKYDIQLTTLLDLTESD